jgi:hypothetical protein
VPSETWRGLSPEILGNLAQSMPAWLQAVIMTKEGHTKY